jgi:hypothetical protein
LKPYLQWDNIWRWGLLEDRVKIGHEGGALMTESIEKRLSPKCTYQGKAI